MSKVITNNHIRDFIDVSDVPESQKDESDCSSWVKYKKMYIPIDEFLLYSGDGTDWDGSYGMTNTSALVIKLVGDDQYIIGVAI